MLRVTRLRKDKDWSQAETARRAGLNATTYNQIETRRLRPYPSQLEKLAAALGWRGDPQDLMDEMD